MLAAVLLSLVASAAAGGGYYPMPMARQVEAGNIVEELQRNGASTLVELAVKAGLADTLSGPGPFTIFAPTNAAFAALPADLVAAVTADTELLKAVLLYHAVAGEVTQRAALAPAGPADQVGPRPRGRSRIITTSIHQGMLEFEFIIGCQSITEF